MTGTEALERRIDELCSENEQLRQQVASIIGRSIRTADKMYCLDTENAKLRELVLYAYECAIHSDHATCDDCRRMNSSCILANRMRELGIEVV